MVYDNKLLSINSGIEENQQPNFSEIDETKATFSENLITKETDSTGWTGGYPTYTHVNGQLACLSFSVNIIKDEFYEITYSRTTTTVAKNFNIIFAKTQTDISGEMIASDVNKDSTLIIQATDNWSFLNIVPDQTWVGSFTIVSFKHVVTQNSASVKIKDIPITINGTNFTFSDGGRIITSGVDNTAFGYNTLTLNTIGDGNSSFGVQSLFNNYSGNYNTSYGYQALASNYSGSYNVSIGYQCLLNNVSGSSNVAIGRQSLLNNSTGLNNVAIGYQTLRNSTTGGNNFAGGYQALFANTTGEKNVAIGYSCLNANTTGFGNIAIGDSSMVSNTIGRENIGIGVSTLNVNIGGSSNIAIGKSSLLLNTNGSNNVSIGVAALQYSTTGTRNVAIGNFSLSSITGLNSMDNVALGMSSGMYLADGVAQSKETSKSVYLGANTRGNIDDAQTNQIVIGYEAIGNGSNTITLGNSEITKLCCQVQVLSALSDTRIKKNIALADTKKCLQAVINLPITRYEYEDFTGVHIDSHVTGWLADDVEKVFPKAVSKQDKYFPVLDENGNQVYNDFTGIPEMFLMKDVKDITMTEALPTLWGAVQELRKEIEILKMKG